MSTRSQNGAPVFAAAADVMRTRSGRALQDAARAPQKTPSRRARKSVTREPYEETPTDPTGKPDADPEQESRTSAATPAPSESTEPQLGSSQSVEKENRAITDTTAFTVPDKSNSKRPNSQTSDKAVKVACIIPVGKPKSGRVWKDRNKQRFSALLRDKPLRSSWQKKMEAKLEKEMLKKYQQQLKDDKAREKEEKRRRREENQRRREENERKGEIVQVIRNTAKIKRMKKKQLRNIEKRDTLGVLQKTPYAIKKANPRTLKDTS